MARKAVCSALTQPNSSKDVLTAKQRAKVEAIKTQLQEGINPYEELANRGQLGGSVNEPKEKGSQFTKERSETEVHTLENKWSHKFDKVEYAELADIDLGPFEPRDPLKHYCSFCGVVVKESELTQGVELTPDGRVLLRKSVKHTVINLPNGSRTFDIDMRHFTTKHKACPEHSLLIRKVDFKRQESEG